MLQTRICQKPKCPERPRVYRPVERTGVCNKTSRYVVSNSPNILPKPSDSSKNLTFCLTVTAKDICPTRPDKTKASEKPRVIQIPSETPRSSILRKPLCTRTGVSENVPTHTSTNPNLGVAKDKDSCESTAKPQPSRTCAIVRASSRGLLHVNLNAPDGEKSSEKAAGHQARENGEVVRTVKPCASSFGRLLSRTKLKRASVSKFLTTSAAYRNKEILSSVAPATQNAANTSRCRSVIPTPIKIRMKQDSGPASSPLPETQKRIHFDNSRSKSSAGQYTASTNTQIARQTKSARSHRGAPEPGDDLKDCLLDEPTVARLAARLEGHVIENNGQNLIAALTPLCAQARSQVINFKIDSTTSSSPFFRACQLSKLPMVEWMLRESEPDLELTGVFLQPGDATLYQVTPLWYASATGNLELVRLLTVFGANVNVSTETGSTAVRAACCTGQAAVVQFLVAHGADLLARTLHGVTCLMSAVHSVALTKFALHHGVPINAADEEGNTALHYTAEAGQPEVTRLLVETGADTSAINKAGCTPLQCAAENRHQDIAEYLIQAVSPNLADIIDAYSVLGAMTIVVSGDTHAGLACWHKALTLTSINSRASTSTPQSLTADNKPFSAQPVARSVTATKRVTFSTSCKHQRFLSLLEKELGVTEIRTSKELSAIASDYSALCTQALLTYERIRGNSHDNLVSLVMYRGAMCADSGDYIQAARLWIVAYQIQLQKCKGGSLDLFHPRIYRNLKFLCRVLCHMGRNSSTRLLQIEEERFTKLFEITCSHVSQSLREPNTERDSIQSSPDILLRALLTFFYAYLQMFPSETRSTKFWQHLKGIVGTNPKDSESKSLLRMCIDQDSFLAYSETPRLNPDPTEAHGAVSWRCRQMLEILLLLGADPLVRDCRGDTVLHATARGLSLDPTGVAVDTDTVTMLLKHGAHPDQVNREAATPCDLLPASQAGVKMLLQNRIKLQCMAARVIVAHGISYVGEIPRALYTFVELHAP